MAPTKNEEHKWYRMVEWGGESPHSYQKDIGREALGDLVSSFDNRTACPPPMAFHNKQQ